MKLILHSIFIFLLIFNYVICFNKYTSEANLNKNEMKFRELDKPYRMAKLNMLWSKAQLVCDLCQSII